MPRQVRAQTAIKVLTGRPAMKCLPTRYLHMLRLTGGAACALCLWPPACLPACLLPTLAQAQAGTHLPTHLPRPRPLAGAHHLPAAQRTFAM